MFSEKKFIEKTAIIHVLVFTIITILGMVLLDMMTSEKAIIELLAKLWIIGIINIISVYTYYAPVYKKYYEGYINNGDINYFTKSEYIKIYNLIIFKLLSYNVMYFCLELLFYLILNSYLELKFPKNINMCIIVIAIFLILSAMFINGLIKNGIINKKIKK